MSEMSLISAVENAGETHLEEIASRLQQLEADRTAISAKIASLEALREVINIRLNGPPPKKEHWTKRRKKETETTEEVAPKEPEEKDSDEEDVVPSNGYYVRLNDRILALVNRTGPLDAFGIARRLSEEESSVKRSASRSSILRVLNDGRIAPADWKDVGEG